MDALRETFTIHRQALEPHITTDFLKERQNGRVIHAFMMPAAAKRSNDSTLTFCRHLVSFGQQFRTQRRIV